jgi:hypothetical protein
MFTKDFDIEKKVMLRKYSNFRHEVGKASVRDPSMIRALHWATSKQNLIGLHLCLCARQIISVAPNLLAHKKEQLQAMMSTYGLKVFLRRTTSS